MEKRNYNVVLQKPISDGTLSSNRVYFYDWTEIPDVPYIVTFSFTASVNTFGSLTNPKFPCIFIDLAQSYNQFARPQNGTSSYSSYFSRLRLE